MVRRAQSIHTHSLTHLSLQIDTAKSAPWHLRIFGIDLILDKVGTGLNEVVSNIINLVVVCTHTHTVFIVCGPLYLDLFVFSGQQHTTLSDYVLMCFGVLNTL